MKADKTAVCDPYVLYATAAVRLWVGSHQKMTWESYKTSRPVDSAFEKEMTGPSSGVFVSLHLNGMLRGCIGTIEPVRDTLADEIVSNAISACSRDPRFPPVSQKELDDLEIGVDLLQPPVPYQGDPTWDVSRYGVVVEGAWGRRGLLLPDLEGVDNAQIQLRIATQKAGLRPVDVEQILLFEVERHG